MIKSDLDRSKFSNEEDYILANIKYWCLRLSKTEAEKRYKRPIQNKPTKEQWEIINNYDFYDLNISNRTRCLLINSRICSIKDLIHCSESKLLKIHGFGRRSLDDVRNQLDKLRQPLKDGERIVFDLFDAQCISQTHRRCPRTHLQPIRIFFNLHVMIASVTSSSWLLIS